MIDILKNKINELLELRVVRYLFVAIAATLVDLLIFWLLTGVGGVDYRFSATTGYLLGTFVNYQLGVMFVFESEQRYSRKVEILFVYAITLTSAGVNLGILYVLHQLNGMNLVYAKLISLGICFFYNFTIKKVFIFGDKPNDDTEQLPDAEESL